MEFRFLEAVFGARAVSGQGDEAAHECCEPVLFWLHSRGVVHAAVAADRLVKWYDVVAAVCEQKAHCKRSIKQLWEDEKAISVLEVVVHGERAMMQALAVREQHRAAISSGADGGTRPVDEWRAAQGHGYGDPVLAGQGFAVDASETSVF